MKKKFTEGEWTIGQNNFCIDILCNDKVLATCWGTVKVRSERIANAKLIASAPDLLEALNDLVLASEKTLQLNEGNLGVLINNAIKAIKKATK